MMPNPADASLSEADFQRQVVDYAHIMGWRVMHVRKSMGRRGGQVAHQTTTSIKGWPDLTCFRPETGEFLVAVAVDSVDEEPLAVAIGRGYFSTRHSGNLDET